MAKINPLDPKGQGNSLFNLKSFNELKKDQTKIKIIKNSSFDSNFNSIQSLNTNLSHLQLQDSKYPKATALKGQSLRKRGVASPLRQGTVVKGGVAPSCFASPRLRGMKEQGNYPKFSAILRAIRSIRLNRDEWKLIRYINQIKKKIISRTPFGNTSLLPAYPCFATLPFHNSEGEGRDRSVLKGLPPFTPLVATNHKWGKGVRGGGVDSGVFTELSPRLRKERKILKKELKKFASLLPTVLGDVTATAATLAPPCFASPRLRVVKEQPTINEAGLQSKGRGLSKESLPKGKEAACTTLRKGEGKEVNKYFYLKQRAQIFKETLRREGFYNKIFSYNNIISKNILLRNMKFNFLKSTLSSILKKKIRLMSEILKDKPIKNYVLYSYLKYCIFSPPHLKGGRTKLSLNKYKGRKFGSFIKYNKIISYNFNSTAPFYQAVSLPLGTSAATGTKERDKRDPFKEDGWNNLNIYNKFINKKEGVACSRGNIYIKDTYKLLFYLFKSMYCLISKPVLKYTNDKITIQLFYYLNIPKKKVFRLFSISYINSIKKKWLAKSTTSPSLRGEATPLWLLRKGVRRESIKTKSNFPSLNKSGQDTNQVFTGGWELLAPLCAKGGTICPPNPSLALQPTNSFLPMSPLRSKRSDSSKSLPPSLGEGEAMERLRVYSQREGTLGQKRGNTKIYIRWKLRKAISRLKNKIITSPSLIGPFKAGLRVAAQRLAGGGKNLLFNLRKFNLTKVYQNKFKLICAILSNKFNKPVELQLIRLHHPYHDSNILVNLLSLNIKNKRKKARVAIQKIYNKNPVKNLNDPNLKKTALPAADSLAHHTLVQTGLAKTGGRNAGKLIPAFLSGLNIKIAGRLMGEPIIPRITTKVFGKGATATGKVNYLDVARITKKNRKGAYTIKITSGQNFF